METDWQTFSYLYTTITNLPTHEIQRQIVLMPVEIRIQDQTVYEIYYTWMHFYNAFTIQFPQNGWMALCELFLNILPKLFLISLMIS